jgi:hypothetical protein
MSEEITYHIWTLLIRTRYAIGINFLWTVYIFFLYVIRHCGGDGGRGAGTVTEVKKEWGGTVHVGREGECGGRRDDGGWGMTAAVLWMWCFDLWETHTMAETFHSEGEKMYQTYL